MTVAKKLIDYFGGKPAKAARALNTDRANVYQWQEKGVIPPNWAFEVEEVTHGEVTALSVLVAYVEKYPPAKFVRSV